MDALREPGGLIEPLDRVVDRCRSCGGRSLRPILSLGAQPLADRLPSPDQLEAPDPLVPLELVLCPSCSLVQLDRTVRRELLFDDAYPYCSSTSSTLVEQARESAAELIRARGLDSSSFVLELASNDGYMLGNFVRAGIPALGVDPSALPAAAARRAGVPTLVEFFDRPLAERLLRERGPADLVIANNVLAHVGDLNETVEGIAVVLARGGLATLEVPYVLDLVDGNEFDTVYHQHLCYFSLTALAGLFQRHGLVISDLRRLDIHGGSLRIQVGRGRKEGESVRAMLAAEAERRVGEPAAYAALARTAGRVRSSLPGLLGKLKRGGSRIAAYGAAAKGTTLLGYCGLGRETIDFVVDRNPVKQGRYLPGCRLEIRPPEDLLGERPEYALLLSWNFAAEILEQQDEYVRQGGRFIVPIPEPRVL
jgi:SAM-dependent methyltransferase